MDREHYRTNQEAVVEKNRILTAVDLALEAEKGIAKRLRDLKDALESGQESEAMRIAREITKAKVRRAA